MRVDKNVKVTYHLVVVQLTVWKHTALGTPIELYASHDLKDPRLKGCILLMGGVHGDEPLGVELAYATLNYLKQAPVSQPWILIPCINPDGYRQKSRTNGRGVDLNRNYPASNWQASGEKNRYYPGPAPASEPEIQGVVDLILLLRPQVIVHCHSWKPCVVCTGTPALKGAQALAQSAGYSVVDHIGYETPGSLSQYGWHDQRIPVICIEESDDAATGTTWDRFRPGMEYIFEHGIL